LINLFDSYSEPYATSPDGQAIEPADRWTIVRPPLLNDRRPGGSTCRAKLPCLMLSRADLAATLPTSRDRTRRSVLQSASERDDLADDALSTIEIVRGEESAFLIVTAVRPVIVVLASGDRSIHSPTTGRDGMLPVKARCPRRY